jgi:thiopeptide-type bacteriocin biosynthesis protein
MAGQGRGAAVVPSQLPPDTDIDTILEALLHMHHNRALGIDRDGEATCRRLARQAALTWIAQQPEQNP